MIRTILARLMVALVVSVTMLPLALPLAAQEVDRPETEGSPTGGAPTLEDILARQRGETVDDSDRRANIGDPDSAASIADQLGTLGGASDPDLWPLA